jgi:hypothetical protein
MDARSARFARRSFGTPRVHMSNSFADKVPEHAQSGATNTKAATEIKASVGSCIDIGGEKQRSHGINVQEGSEAEQESEQY